MSHIPGVEALKVALSADTFPSQEEFQGWLQDLWQAEKQRQKRGMEHSFPLTVNSSEGMELESWSRLLWALLPAALGLEQEQGGLPDWLEEVLEETLLRVKKGCDPHDPDFFGLPEPYDQRFVEMAVLGLAFELFPERFVASCLTKEKKRICDWFGQIYRQPIPDNNWLFFRCFVSLGLLRLTAKESTGFSALRESWEASVQNDLERLDSFYLGSGWYGDGPGGKRDYYNPFGFHTYSLLLYSLRPDITLLRSFRARVLEFLPTYAALFDCSGAAIAYGRSMTYRFAQGSLLSACICLGVYHEKDNSVPAWCTLAWLKTMLHRHLRYWLNQPIFNEGGRLSVGYGYPNLFMAEQYNAYGSPGWGLKTLWFLSLPSSHPFWATALDESSLTLPDGPKKEPCLPGLLVRAEQGRHVFLLNGGQLTPEQKDVWVPRHAEAKYAKFVYSSRFGFAVGTGPCGLGQCGPDSTLAVSLDGDYWRTRRWVENATVRGEEVEGIWRPFDNNDLSIFTRLVPLQGGHIRIHEIESEITCWLNDGGFACPFAGKEEELAEKFQPSERQLTLTSENLFSSAFPLSFTGEGQKPELARQSLDIGSHLLFPRAHLPSVRLLIHPGKHRWVTAFHGGFAEGLKIFLSALKRKGLRSSSKDEG